ncbi:MAG TPA: low temperature requirement protein A [Terriglobia bacterium]|nr:low temperature requirement protein A [Terriglobia bacterium]
MTGLPRLWASDFTPHRRVTWLELFFDLVFVAAVAEVGSPLSGDYSPAGLLRYAFLFVLIWWGWSGHTLYCTRFDHDDLVNRLLLLGQCFIAAVMAANAKEALDSRSSAGFAAAYAGMRIMQVLQYLRARSLPATRKLTTRYAAGFGTAALLWVASAVVEPPERYWLWGVALAVDFATPWFAAQHSRRFPPDAAHFPERFGLFTIILLGEFVAAVMRGIESQEYWSFAAASTAFTGMAFAFAVRWWYFDVAKSAQERHIRNSKQARLFELWQYAHLPLFLGIGVAGVGFQRAISLPVGAELGMGEARILCGAVAVVIASLMAIGATAEGGLGVRNLWGQAAILGVAALLWAMPVRTPRVVLAASLLAAAGGPALVASRCRQPPRKNRAAAGH